MNTRARGDEKRWPSLLLAGGVPVAVREVVAEVRVEVPSFIISKSASEPSHRSCVLEDDEVVDSEEEDEVTALEVAEVERDVVLDADLEEEVTLDETAVPWYWKSSP